MFNNLNQNDTSNDIMISISADQTSPEIGSVKESMGSLEQTESTVQQSYSEAIDEFQTTVPFINCSVSADSLEQDSLEIVCRIFPQWVQDDLHISRCTDGITNKLLKVVNRSRKGKAVLVRCYGTGTSSIIDRENELVSLVTLSKMGFAPPLYGRFINGFCYGFIAGRVLTSQDLADMSSIGPLVAKQLAHWHSIDFPVKQDSMRGRAALWATMERWLALVPGEYKQPAIQQKFVENINILGCDIISREIELMQSRLEHSPHSRVVFCHNDLLAANIIYHEATSDPDIEAHVSFIDYEYGSYSYDCFDIANHFNEFCGVECDFSKFPAAPVQKQWIRHYLRESKRIRTASKNATENNNNNSTADSYVSDDEVDNLYDDVQKFALVSHFFWAIWGLVQASVSDIDFDYMEYSIMRFQQYYTMKEYIKF